MVNQKKRILGIIIVLLICILVVVAIHMILEKKKEIASYGIATPEDWYYFDSSKIERVGNRSDYILIEKCVKKYFDNYSNKDYINNLLADDYIKSHNIKIQSTKIQDEAFDILDIEISNMYVTEIKRAVYFYYVNGLIIESQGSNSKEFELAVIRDNINQTFGIVPEEYLIKMGYSNINENSKITFKGTDKIKNKEVNTFKYKFINDETYMADYLFPDFINKCLSNVNKAYECLDDEYKEKKFGSIEKFQEFVDDKKELYLTQNPKNAKKPEDFEDSNDYISYLYEYEPLTIVSAENKNVGGSVQYVLIDNVGNYYIFREDGTMNYKVILDTYTLELPEFIEEYKVSDNKTKTAMNIQKVFDALNDKDYKYAYSKLADSFKSNYFPTLESFETYAKKTFGTGNSVKYNRFIETANYCTFEISIGKNKNAITKTIIMKLEEGTDFVMSFNVD